MRSRVKPSNASSRCPPVSLREAAAGFDMVCDENISDPVDAHTHAPEIVTWCYTLD